MEHTPLAGHPPRVQRRRRQLFVNRIKFQLVSAESDGSQHTSPK
ncbi:MAG: hypothetical protein AAGI46_04690 [Planctomycetota bacterium]